MSQYVPLWPPTFHRPWAGRGQDAPKGLVGKLDQGHAEYVPEKPDPNEERMDRERRSDAAYFAGLSAPKLEPGLSGEELLDALWECVEGTPAEDFVAGAIAENVDD